VLRLKSKLSGPRSHLGPGEPQLAGGMRRDTSVPTSRAVRPVCSVLAGHTSLCMAAKTTWCNCLSCSNLFSCLSPPCRAAQFCRDIEDVSALKLALSFQQLPPFPSFSDYSIKEDIKGCSAVKLASNFLLLCE